jgi:DNA helicase-2/ATP-dependent DNA helicase PcrA
MDRSRDGLERKKMSTKRTDELLGISRQAEEQYLAQTLEVIHNNVTNYGRDVARMRAEIDDMLEHFHDDNPELINTLENTMTMHDSLYRALGKNERALKKPYFGRIIFHDESLKKDESLYIGKGGIAKDATHLVVVDWRAPVSNAYYENGLGKCSYPSPEGK